MIYTLVYGLIKRKVTSKLLFFFVAYLPELATDPNENIYSINTLYKDFSSLSNKGLALFFSQQRIY